MTIPARFVDDMDFQNAYSPLIAIHPGKEMFQRRESVPLFPPGSLFALDNRLSRAISDATELWEGDESSDEEDDDDGHEEEGVEEEEEGDDATEIYVEESSDFEEDNDIYEFSHISSMHQGRQSQSTISTFDEVATPADYRRNDIDFVVESRRSVEGPVGPHLFRSSTQSSDYDFNFALQLSPIVPKSRDPASMHFALQPLNTASTLKGFPSDALHVAPQDEQSSDNDAEPWTWSASKVAHWMAQHGVDANTCELFQRNNVTGAVLLHMSFEDLKEADIRSSGKRHLLWGHICELREGTDNITPIPIPVQGVSRIGSRRRRNGFNSNDPITPAESVSIVAIEQLLPKLHKCAKGEKCSKWKKQQKLLKKIQDETGTPAFPVSPGEGGRILFAGDPGNATTAPNVLDGSNGNTLLNPADRRPFSDALPSVVASSDLLGPGEQPRVTPALREQLLQHLVVRDPQENVLNFLTFQHIEPPQALPVTPIDTPKMLDMFPTIPTVMPTGERGPSQLTGLRDLPKLTIPRSTSAGPDTQGAAIVGGHTSLQQTAVPPPRPIAASPVNGSIYRFGTPATDMDVPVSSFPVGPDARDMTRSVPPNMQYRDPVARTGSAATFQRRGPSFALPTLGENEVYTAAMAADPRQSEDTTCSTSDSDTSGNKGTVACRAAVSHRSSAASQFKGVDHAGWMKKRRTRFLRHGWADHQFRLTGTQLAMHGNSMPSSSPPDTLNIDDYAVACASIASGKLAAKLKALGLGKEKGFDPSAFSFQLVPAPADRKAGGGAAAEHRKLVKIASGGKTHHFAVHTRDERIDWMRELMLAKALNAKTKEGYDVQRISEEVAA